MSRERKIIMINGRKKTVNPEERTKNAMFDMNNVGRKIAELRRAGNMTQMELADKMNISFQAVSNWERGVSMPDISKLPELAELFEVSIDELLGEKSEIIESAAADAIEEYVENNDVSAEELSKAAPMLKPSQVDVLIEGVKSVRLKDNIGLMPFVKSDTVDRLILAAAENGDFDGIAAAAPFAGKEALGRVAEMMTEQGKRIAGIAPFLSKGFIDGAARKRVERGESINDIAVFVKRSTLDELIIQMAEKGMSVNGIAVYASRAAINEAAVMLAKKGRSISGLMPYVSRETIDKIITGRASGDIPAEDYNEVGPRSEKGHSDEKENGEASIFGTDISAIVQQCMDMARQAADMGREAAEQGAQYAAYGAQYAKNNSGVNFRFSGGGESEDNENSPNIRINISESDRTDTEGRTSPKIRISISDNDDESDFGDMDTDELAALARERVSKGEDIDDIACELDEDDLDDIARQMAEKGMDISGVIEHMSEDGVDDIAWILYERDGAEVLVQIAEHCSEDALSEVAVKAYERDGIAPILAVAEFIDSEALGEIAEKAFEKDGMAPILAIAEFVDSEVLTRIAARSIVSNGAASISPIADYIDEDELGGYIKDLL